MTAPRDKLGRPVVVVTGMGIMTSLGAGKADNWAKLVAGESGIRTITRFPVDGLKTTMAGTVDFVSVDPFSSTGLSERMAELVTQEALGLATSLVQTRRSVTTRTAHQQARRASELFACSTRSSRNEEDN